MFCQKHKEAQKKSNTICQNNIAMTSQEIETRLSANGVQPTAMRKLVFEYLLEQKAAVNLSQAEEALAHSDRTTLYRTLKTFEASGLIHAIDDGSGAVKYALCEEACVPVRHRDLHLHFHCTKCDETTCLPTILIPHTEMPKGYEVTELNLIAKGTCASCARK